MSRRSFPFVAMALAAFSAMPPAAAQQATSDPSAQVQSLREDLIGAQQEIVRLRAELDKRTELEASLNAAREKNERLVAIANELIAAYQKRYRRGEYAPFDTGRRKFEAELQDMGDRVYDSRWDAGPRRAVPSAAASPARPTRE